MSLFGRTSAQWLALVQKIQAFYVSVVKILISTILFIAFLFITYSGLVDLFSVKIIIKPFTVPPVLEEKGYTGRVILSRLIRKMEEIRRAVSSENNPVVEIAPPEEQPDIEIPGAGVSLQGIMSYLGIFVGTPPLEIIGSVVLDEEAHMIISIPGKKTGDFASDPNEFYTVIDEAAIHILKTLEPLTLARYFYVHKEWRALEKLSIYIERNDPSAGERAIALLIDGLVLFGDKQDYQGALQRWQWAEGLDPNNPAAPYHQGWALDELQRYSEAEAKFQRALQLAPDFVGVYNSWGIMLFNMNKLTNAIDMFKKAIDLNPNYAKGYNNWGYILMEMGQLTEAIDKFKQAIRIDPKNPEFHDSWGDALVRLEQFEQGAQKFHQAITLDPQFDGAFFRYGRALLAIEGREQEGLNKIVRAISLNPDKISYRTILAEALIQQSAKEDRIRALAAALIRAPEEPLANLQLGQALLQRKDNAIALPYLQRAWQLDREGKIGTEAIQLVQALEQQAH